MTILAQFDSRMSGRWTIVALVVATSAVVPSTVAATVAENESPLADAGLDQHAERGQSVLLDATGSRDPDGEIAAYEWRIETPGGSVVRPACADCGRTRFTADEVGEYAVTVTVTEPRRRTRCTWTSKRGMRLRLAEDLLPLRRLPQRIPSASTLRCGTPQRRTVPVTAPRTYSPGSRSTGPLRSVRIGR